MTTPLKPRVGDIAGWYSEHGWRIGRVVLVGRRFTHIRTGGAISPAKTHKIAHEKVRVTR